MKIVIIEDTQKIADEMERILKEYYRYHPKIKVIKCTTQGEIPLPSLQKIEETMSDAQLVILDANLEVNPTGTLGDEIMQLATKSGIKILDIGSSMPAKPHDPNNLKIDVWREKNKLFDPLRLTRVKAINVFGNKVYELLYDLRRR